MSERDRVKFAAMLQRENQPLFQKFFDGYAAEHSRSRAQYMKENVSFWASGKVEIQPESLRRFGTVRFPDTSEGERDWLIRRYVEDGLSVRLRSFEVDFRIESHFEASVAWLRSIVRNFTERPYNAEIATEFYNGLVWVLQGETAEFWHELEEYIRPQGEAAFNEVSAPIEACIYLMQQNAVPIPFRRGFQYPGGRIDIDYNHSLGKRMGERLKFWKATPPPPAIPPESERKFACPNSACRRVMLLTPEEARAQVFACPWCWQHGRISKD